MQAHYEIKLKSGVVLYVTPLSIPARENIGKAAAAKFPPPNETPFRKKVEHAADPNMTYLDDKDPEYRRLWAEVKERREQFVIHMCIKLSVKMADENAKSGIIAAYHDYVDTFRQAGVDVIGDDWLDTLLIGVLGFEDDYNTVMKAINGKLPLTETEIADALIIFRTVI